MRARFPLALVSVGVLFAAASPAAEATLETFQREVQPLLAKYCFDCHGNGVDKAGVRLDAFETAAELHDPRLWLRALKNLRSGLMPPADELQPTAAERETILAWIKRDAFGLDPARPDAGRVTVRRLNRVEYRNTIRDLTGVDFDTRKEFPADDTGYGFDNIADVLTISPMLLEKYLDAAQAIVMQSVPLQPRVVAEQNVPGRTFETIQVDTVLPEAARAAAAEREKKEREVLGANRAADPGRRGRAPESPPAYRRPAPYADSDSVTLSYYTPATVAARHRVAHAGKYQLVLELRTLEQYVEDRFDSNKCRLTFSVDGREVFAQEFMREGGRKFEFPIDQDWAAGEHALSVAIEPLTPERPQIRNLRLQLAGVTVRGPLAGEHWVKPKNYEKTFPREAPPDLAGRRAYARELLQAFATRAFRRPVDAATLERLVGVAEGVFSRPKNTFEAGVAQAMVAVLASPSFLFREERTLPAAPGARQAPLDEYALASRLSYFFWSTLPDAELFRLARDGQLRAHLPAQIERMLADARAREFVRNFTGQWLQARDIVNVPITALDVFLRDHPSPEYEEARRTFRRLGGRSRENRPPEEAEAIAKARSVYEAFNQQPKPELTGELRRAMQEETELTFAYILKEDRSVLELLESDYTFLNEELAKHYGIPGVTGRTLRKVTLPPDSPRGGVLTQGTVLTVTSNPTRTSPVKRGVFVLDAILGTPPPPPPPNIPALEDAAPADKLRQLNLRETLALHAKEPLCSSCHLRMDPIGLALENFNAMGRWRTSDLGQPIEPAGRLITGEPFAGIRELKHVLATKRHRDFYYAFSERLLTYALGRGLEYYDTTTVDQLVDALERSGGRPSALLRGIVGSAAFQQRRLSDSAAASRVSANVP